MRHLCLIAVCGTAIWTAACSGPTSSTSVTTTSEGEASRAVPGKEAALGNAGLIRFFNADPQRKSLSVYSQKKLVFSNIAYKKITPYKEAERGVSMFTLRAADKADLANNRRELFPGRHYTCSRCRTKSVKRNWNPSATISARSIPAKPASASSTQPPEPATSTFSSRARIPASFVAPAAATSSPSPKCTPPTSKSARREIFAKTDF